ncbi:ERI1 exoribonuclease 3-like [Centruroides sculpturatus]|uniref:ERI1 exoribonuclease 3-like n=1 Tax=Centruroides sculpturatus TaxID=218467 RepID=UPI000C6E05BA|nr:ERI1 exoribonuclease 3-like [Centruroides sculpturatus]
MAAMFDYFLVLDFEATCHRHTKLNPQEIIEFPVIKVNGKTFETESEFHEYVQPYINKKLSSFCTELTGISQEMIENKKHLEEVLQDFQLWMEKEVLLKPKVKFAFVTCGDWDLKKM